MIIVVWGVSGCGKSTIGAMLAEALGWQFYDADDFHPQANKEKMRGGTPLTDADRWPWLDILRDLLTDALSRGGSAVLACSALKQSYRDHLRQVGTAVRFVQLEGDFELIAERLERRQHAFMNKALLASQFATLEPDSASLAFDVAESPDDLVVRIQAAVGGP